jgi:hypothetical protein
MLVFIIPLKSSQVSGSWELVCKLFERTLRSVCSQTSSKFKVIVVCHEQPSIVFNHSHVTYVTVDFPIPSQDYASKEKDKMGKMLIGLIHAQAFNPSHVMFIDADDCVSKYLAEFVNHHPNHNGWFIGKGYEYREDTQLLKIRNKNFHLRTNTSHIIKYDLLEPDLKIGFDDVKRENCVLYHVDTTKILKARGAPLSLLPFRGVIYITDNGENMWWNQASIAAWAKNVGFKQLLRLQAGKLYQLFITRPLTNMIRDEFGIYEISAA